MVIITRFLDACHCEFSISRTILREGSDRSGVVGIWARNNKVPCSEIKIDASGGPAAEVISVDRAFREKPDVVVIFGGSDRGDVERITGRAEGSGVPIFEVGGDGPDWDRLRGLLKHPAIQ
jgi:hypothetical protein|tara:strand:- start:983 stop:1345 length:363 start_codon:yes stop_codon:yes gene_type:complete